MQWHRHSFETLPKKDLYDILRLRSDIFVVEQDCVYLDLDNQDQTSFPPLRQKQRRGCGSLCTRFTTRNRLPPGEYRPGGG
jgi:predicted GNAT family N-acyltransferase